MADNEDKTPRDQAAGGGAGAERKPSGGTEEPVIHRPDLQPRILSPSEREILRARLQKKFH